MACPAGRVVIHNFARRAILDALAPADRLLDVGCGGGLLLRHNSDDTAGPHKRTHDTLHSLEDTPRKHNAAVFAITSENPTPTLVSQAREHQAPAPRSRSIARAIEPPAPASDERRERPTCQRELPQLLT
jgi:hypothetical protein